MIIDLIVDSARLRRWHLDLADRIRRERPGVATQFRLAGGPALTRSVESLLRFERLTQPHPGPRPSDLVGAGAAPAARLEEVPDLVLDFGLDGAPAPAANSGRPWLRTLYDGLPDESALFGALFEGRAPFVEIQDQRNGRILARGLPSIENARGIASAYEEVVARVPTLMLAALGDPSSPGLPARVGAHSGIEKFAAVAHLRKSLPHAAARLLYKLFVHAPHWRIGWRVVGDQDVWTTQGLGGPAWNVVPDPGHRFYADPFPIVWRGQTYLFCEDLDHRTGKGVISAAAFDERGPLTPMRPVLEEPWHLSYPFLIEHAGEIWMVPESSADRSIKLYRAAPFPWRWELAATLVSEIEASDATIVREAGRFWLFATTRDGAGSHSDTLSIFMADDLFGPWTAHPANPVLVDSASARPAGAIVRRGGRLWRPVQDCRIRYGAALGLAEITRLDEEGFEQVVRCVVAPGPDWPGRRLHTLNRAGSMEFIDGSRVSPKLRLPALPGVSRGPRTSATADVDRPVSNREKAGS